MAHGTLHSTYLTAADSTLTADSTGFGGPKAHTKGTPGVTRKAAETRRFFWAGRTLKPSGAAQSPQRSTQELHEWYVWR